MSTDPTLFDLAELVDPDYTPQQTIAERFAEFDRLNGWVYAALESLVADWLAHGHKRVGVKALLEIVRWQYGRRTSGDQGFRVNNDFTSRYARLLIERHPEWADAIETRQLRAA